MDCELLATCSALGYLEGDTYHKEADCLGEWFLWKILQIYNTFPASSVGSRIGDIDDMDLKQEKLLSSSNCPVSVLQRAWKTWSGIYAMKMTPVTSASSWVQARSYRMTFYLLSSSMEKKRPYLMPASGINSNMTLLYRILNIYEGDK